MDSIVTSLSEHIGSKVLLRIRDGRKIAPIIGKLRRVADRIYAEYQLYDRRGMPQSTRNIYISPAMIHTGEVQVDYFDN